MAIDWASATPFRQEITNYTKYEVRLLDKTDGRVYEVPVYLEHNLEDLEYAFVIRYIKANLPYFKDLDLEWIDYTIRNG